MLNFAAFSLLGISWLAMLQPGLKSLVILAICLAGLTGAIRHAQTNVAERASTLRFAVVFLVSSDALLNSCRTALFWRATLIGITVARLRHRSREASSILPGQRDLRWCGPLLFARACWLW